mmetsp:Transcript_15093/g.37191  ORF Transcript_15093/g.37191 Transcript_15093/m.37191 type:complete len:598 (-) Transcript_15093:55-1848(-)
MAPFIPSSSSPALGPTTLSSSLQSILSHGNNVFDNILPVNHPWSIGRVWQGPQAFTSSSASSSISQLELEQQQHGQHHNLRHDNRHMIKSIPHPSHQESVRLVFRNLSPVPLILCWVTDQGQLRHWYRLDPVVPPVPTERIHDHNHAQIGDEKYYVPLPQDHIENSQTGDSFCLIYCCCTTNDNDHDVSSTTALAEECVKAVQDAKTLDGVFIENEDSGYRGRRKVSASVVAGYRPSRAGSSDRNSSDATKTCHLVTISHVSPAPQSQSLLCSGSRNKITGCTTGCFAFRRRHFLRKRKVDEDEDDDGDEYARDIEEGRQHNDDDVDDDNDKILCPNNKNFMLDLNGWKCRPRLVKLDTTPVDTTSKKYEEVILGGWPCMVESGCWGPEGDESLQKQLSDDIAEAAKKLPFHAREYLRKHCKIYINKSMCWGPKCAPVYGRGACYHPDENWLVENGMCPDKHMCVEFNDIKTTYKSDRGLWGAGGLVLHELCHAYHHHLVEDGYRNKYIEDVYQNAMNEKLYERVKVKGRQGPTAKAYACSNCFEYFAELSTAFLGGTGIDKDADFNKWYPFNRQDLEIHDPRAFEMLACLWKIENP